MKRPTIERQKELIQVLIVQKKAEIQHINVIISMYRDELARLDKKKEDDGLSAAARRTRA